MPCDEYDSHPRVIWETLNQLCAEVRSEDAVYCRTCRCADPMGIQHQMVQALLHGVLRGLTLTPPSIHFWIVFTRPAQCKQAFVKRYQAVHLYQRA